MGESADRILRALDAGLQSSVETGSTEAAGDPTSCVHCQERPPIEGGDFCPECRAWMLGDRPDDPARPTSERQYLDMVDQFEALLQSTLEDHRPQRWQAEALGRMWITAEQPGPFLVR